MSHEQRKAIQSTIARLGAHAKAEQIVEELRRYGVEVSKKYVTQVKGQLLRDEARASQERSKRPPQTKSRHRPQQRKIP